MPNFVEVDGRLWLRSIRIAIEEGEYPVCAGGCSRKSVIIDSSIVRSITHNITLHPMHLADSPYILLL